MRAFDYVIVGAGSAGCTLARRLGEDRGARILVLEAGPWSRDPWVRIPMGWGRILQRRLHDWGYFAEPEETVGGRRVECARGKVVGGSSAINAMTYVRGHASDYDRWAAAGLSGWSYADALPYFRKQESWEGGPNDYRGGDGPIRTRESRYADPLVDAVIEAGVAAGHPVTPDYNGAEQHGFGRLQSMIRDGRRCDAAAAYLRPAMAGGNVTVLTGKLCSSIVFEGARAVGVRCGEDVFRAQREVVVAAGTINSPQLLMLSGIGDPDELRAHGIDVRVPLKGVGRNLQDHVSAALRYERREPGLLHRHMRYDRLALALAQAWCLGRGFATDLPSGVLAFLKTDHARGAPDVQMLFHAGPLGAAPYLGRGFVDGFAAVGVLLRPESRGRVRLASADPGAAPRIHQNFLATERDWTVLLAGLRLLREVGRQKPLAPFVAKELAPEDLRSHVRASSITVHHPLGTCRMGLAGDDEAVVDRELRVFGVEGLRVVDASVMPDLPGGNINAAVVMIAERASDLIRGKA